MENGWNLYLCGNGGMKFCYVDLFVLDLDDEILIKYIDCFLMFYIKIVDCLQWILVWMDNLEGGLDYLCDVVMNDLLGIGDELEVQMVYLVDMYQCEWKIIVENFQKLKCFNYFVNIDEKDSNVVFVKECGQICFVINEEKLIKIVVV